MNKNADRINNHTCLYNCTRHRHSPHTQMHRGSITCMLLQLNTLRQRLKSICKYISREMLEVWWSWNSSAKGQIALHRQLLHFWLISCLLTSICENHVVLVTPLVGACYIHVTLYLGSLGLATTWVHNAWHQLMMCVMYVYWNIWL